jgi:hypothetical protein
VPTVLKSWSLNLLETSGPVKACNGIALTFTYTLVFAYKIAEHLISDNLPYDTAVL